jgi:DNA-binding MarR family transcriptional regulator
MSDDPEFELSDFTPYLLNAAAEAQSRRFSRVYKDRYGMLRTEWRVLFHLGRYGAMSAREISQRAGIHKTKVSRAVAALERKRFSNARQAPADRRVEILNCARPGRAAFRRSVAGSGAHERELEARLGADTLALADLREKLRRLLGVARWGLPGFLGETAPSLLPAARRSRSGSGIDGAAPARVTEIAAVAVANRRAARAWHPLGQCHGEPAVERIARPRCFDEGTARIAGT